MRAKQFSLLCQTLLAVFVVFTLFIGFSSSVAAKEIMVEGYGESREEAINDGLRNAIEQAVGVLVDSETVVKNLQLVKDEIYTQSRGFVNGFEVLSETEDNGGVRVRLKAVVDTAPNSQLLSKLQQLNLIQYGLEDPRIAVLIPDGAGETAVIGKLIDGGFSRVVDPRLLAEVRRQDVIRALWMGDMATAKWFGTKYNVDYILVGEVTSEYVGSMGGGIHSGRSRIDARLLKVTSGEIVATHGSTAGGADITPKLATKKAVTQAGEQMGDYMVERLFDYGSNTEKGVQLILTNVHSFGKVAAIERQLKKIRGVNQVYIRDYSKGIATIDIDYQGNSKTLVKSLSETMEVTSVAQHSIQAKVI